jgi:phage repressor protein C with HTH and peptisase S24 domain
MDFFDEATLRLKQQLQVTEDQEAAAVLGMSKHAWMGRKKRGNFPEAELYVLAAKRPELCLDPEYILSGMTPFTRLAVDAAKSWGELRALRNAPPEELPVRLADQAQQAKMHSRAQAKARREEEASMDSKAQRRGERIREERDRLGWSQQQAADAAGMPCETWAGCEAGAEPGAEALSGMVASGVDVLYILTGERASARSALTPSEAAPESTEMPYAHQEHSQSLMAMEPQAGYVAIPLYSEIQASAGHGATSNREQAADDIIMFREDWIRYELGARPQDLLLIRVHGDSMEPTLRAGDVILVDGSASRPNREGIYVLRLGDALLVKRLQVLPGRKIRVTSDNATFESWMIDVDANTDATILGRVIWSGRRH